MCHGKKMIRVNQKNKELLVIDIKRGEMNNRVTSIILKTVGFKKCFINIYKNYV